LTPPDPTVRGRLRVPAYLTELGKADLPFSRATVVGSRFLHGLPEARSGRVLTGARTGPLLA